MQPYLQTFFTQIGILQVEPTPGTVLARGRCFLHDGDNQTSFLFYHDGFACQTDKCHTDSRFGSRLGGLLRHMVFRLTGEIMEWRPAWTWARTNIEAMRGLIKGHIHAAVVKEDKPVLWTRDELLSCLFIPDPLYLSRGYRAETLDHFGVGRAICKLPDGKDLFGWSVIPCWGPPDQPPHGYTARNPRWVKNGTADKWKHVVRRGQHLFNAHEAAQGSRDILFITEGPGCVLRLFGAGFPHAVATLGNSMTDDQLLEFQALIAPNQQIIIAADEDKGGHGFGVQVRDKISSVCDPIILFPPAGFKDVGDMPTAQVAEWLQTVAGEKRG
jgi:hypothetical protein